MDHYPNRVIILQFAIFDISEATEICFSFFNLLCHSFPFQLWTAGIQFDSDDRKSKFEFITSLIAKELHEIH